MALLKKHTAQAVEELPSFSTLDEAVDFFESIGYMDQKGYAVEEISRLHGGGKYLVSYMKNHDADKAICTKIASVLSSMEPEEAPIEEIMELLKLSNAYMRNLGISMLQNFGDAIKFYIVKFLIGEDRDLKIFAINVLGDVNFEESREMLIELLEKESDINVAMTAVDYMGEIGEMTDIPLLESLKERFRGDFYVEFAVDGAINLIRG